MVRGCKRRMVIVSGLRDSSFETAYLVLKDNVSDVKEGDVDIIDRANSLVESLYSDSKIKKNKATGGGEGHERGIKIGSFILGFALGAIVCLSVILAVTI